MQQVELRNELQIKGIYSLMYQEKDTNFIFPGEVHDFWELIYMDKGFAYLMIDDKGYKVNQGELFLFNKNQNHILWSDSRSAPCFLTISFDMKFDDECFFEYKRFKVNDEIMQIIHNILRERDNLFEGSINSGICIKKTGRMAGSEQLVKMYIEELILKLYRIGENSDKAVISSSVKLKSENMIARKCMDYIDIQIGEKICLKDVCCYIPISHSYLNRIFRNETGLSIMEYVMDAKLEKAKSLIRESGLNFTEVSDRLGFSSVHYFSRIFKKRHKISPREYARSIKD